jgi:hypothetical protein
MCVCFIKKPARYGCFSVLGCIFQGQKDGSRTQYILSLRSYIVNFQLVKFVLQVFLTDTTAVFTQIGKVAAVGDNLADGTTLSQIWATAGVAINHYDLQVAFHGKVGTTDAMFVGLAPIAAPGS